MAKSRFGSAPLEESEKRSLNRHNVQYLLGIYRFMAPYKEYFFFGLLCLFFSSGIIMAFPEFTGKLVDAATGKSTLVLENINEIAATLIVILLVQSVFSYLRVFLFSRVSERSMADIRKSLYAKLLHLPISYHDKQRTGELMSRITSDVALLQDTFSVTLAELFRQLLTLIFGLVWLFIKTPKLTIFMLAIVPVLVVAAMVFGKFIRTLSKKTQDELAKANVIVEETLQAIFMVKAFTNELFERERYSQSQNIVVETALKAAKFRGAFVSFIIFTLFGSIVAVLWFGARLVAAGELSIGELTSFVIYTMFIGGSIAGLGDLYGQIQKAIGSSERILEILSLNSEEQIQEGKESPKDASAEIFFENVHFSYPSRKDMEVLKGVSFKVHKGEKVAIVGHSGAGKSTILQLLLRFYSPINGQISFNGKPIQAYDLKEFRSLIGIVPQEVILFGGSLKENIAYGKPNASFEEIREAARKANALQFIESFPEGFDTLVGERGVKLSGGQRQRIAIARAILKDPKILILDEATSSLDAESEQAVQKGMQELMNGRTTIVIAHRLATIRNVDSIVVLDQGTIKEQGTHEELLLSEGMYNQLFRMQMVEA